MPFSDMGFPGWAWGVPNGPNASFFPTSTTPDKHACPLQ